MDVYTICSCRSTFSIQKKKKKSLNFSKNDLFCLVYEFELQHSSSV